MNYTLLHVISGGLCLAVAIQALSRRRGLEGMRLALGTLTGGAAFATACHVGSTAVEGAAAAFPYVAGVRIGIAAVGAGAVGAGFALWSRRLSHRGTRVTLVTLAVFALGGVMITLRVPIDLVIRSSVSWHVDWAPVRIYDSLVVGLGTVSVTAGAVRRLRMRQQYGRSTMWKVLAIQLACSLAYFGVRWFCEPRVFQAVTPLIVASVAVSYWMVLHRWRFAGVSDEALGLLFEQLPTPSIVIDLHSNGAVANPSARALLGGDPDVDGLVRRLGLGDRAEALFAGRVSRTVLSLRLGGGGERVFDLLCDFDAQRGIGLLLFSDVTEREAHAAELSGTVDELRRAKDQLVQQEKMAALGVLVAGVNHEINNPLAYVTANLREVTGYVQSAVEGAALVRRAEAGEEDARERLSVWARSVAVRELEAEALPAISEALEGCNRIRDTVSSMRMLSRKGGQDEVLDLSEVARAGLKIGRTALSPSIDVSASLQQRLSVRGSAGELSRVVTNLVVNAGQAMGTQGRLTVRTLLEGDTAILEVSDDGPGVSADHRSRIFDPFFTTKPPGEGTGLGLAIAYEAMRRHHGELALVDSPRGACFQMRLPVVSVEDTEVTPLPHRLRVA